MLSVALNAEFYFLTYGESAALSTPYKYQNHFLFLVTYLYVHLAQQLYRDGSRSERHNQSAEILLLHPLYSSGRVPARSPPLLLFGPFVFRIF